MGNVASDEFIWCCIFYMLIEYMPPEMIRGKAYNQAADWWALGALIYEMVTGYPPFQHKNRKKLHHKILNEKVQSTHSLCY